MIKTSVSMAGLIMVYIGMKTQAYFLSIIGGILWLTCIVLHLEGQANQDKSRYNTRADIQPETHSALKRRRDHSNN